MILGDSLLVMTSLAEKEALEGAGFDLLVACGFAFDAHAEEGAKEFSPAPAKRKGGSPWRRKRCSTGSSRSCSRA